MRIFGKIQITMQNHKINFFIFTNWLIKSTCVIGLTGMSTLTSLPILSQENYLINLFQPDTISQDKYRTVKNNLVATLEEEGNFENLVAEIEIAGLTEKLEEEQFTTLLAFRDEAFDALPDDIYDKFSQPENRKKVLQYHLIPGQVTQEDLDRGKIVTVEGNTIAVSSNNGNSKLNDANATFPSTPANNGVIIEIDQVLLPPDF